MLYIFTFVPPNSIIHGINNSRRISRHDKKSCTSPQGQRLQSSNKKFRIDIETIGFQVNPNDICVANRIVNGKQHTITGHVNDAKLSHVNPKGNDYFWNGHENVCQLHNWTSQSKTWKGTLLTCFYSGLLQSRSFKSESTKIC